MPELSNILAAFATVLTKGRGGTVRGYFRAPQNVRATFDGLFTPRSMLLVPAGQDLVAGDVVGDSFGNHFLCGTWAESIFMNNLVCQVFVIFDAPLMLSWGRQIVTTEPISGMSKLVGTQNLGMIQGLKETIGKVKDNTNIPQSIYRVMSGSPIQLDDFIDGRRVQRLEQTLGLYYAETL